MTSLHNITYGLFILTAKNDTKQNGPNYIQLIYAKQTEKAKFLLTISEMTRIQLVLLPIR